MDSYDFKDLGADLWERFRGWVPFAALIAVFSAAFWGLSTLAEGVAYLGTGLTLIFVLSALLAAGVGIAEVVAQEERSRLLALAATAYGLLAVILTMANSIADAFVR